MSEPIIELTNLCKTFYVGFRRKRVDAVKGVSLRVEPGEIFGLIGPNGAGKTTTIKMLTGLISPTSGQMKLMGFDGFDRQCSRKLGYLPEVSYYYESLTAFEILDFYAKLYGIRENRAKTVDFWLERGLAQALIGDPELIILDEPQSGLDPIGRRDVAEIIRECQNKGKTIFFSSHILPDVERLCDRVGVIRQGKMEKLGTLHELVSSEKSIEIILRGTPNQEFIEQLKQDSDTTHHIKDETVSITLGPKSATHLNELLSRAISDGLIVEHVMERGADLESLFTKDSDTSTDSNEKKDADKGKANEPASSEEKTNAETKDANTGDVDKEKANESTSSEEPADAETKED